MTSFIENGDDVFRLLLLPATLLPRLPHTLVVAAATSNICVAPIHASCHRAPLHRCKGGERGSGRDFLVDDSPNGLMGRVHVIAMLSHGQLRESVNAP